MSFLCQWGITPVLSSFAIPFFCSTRAASVLPCRPHISITVARSGGQGRRSRTSLTPSRVERRGIRSGKEVSPHHIGQHAIPAVFNHGGPCPLVWSGLSRNLQITQPDQGSRRQVWLRPGNSLASRGLLRSSAVSICRRCGAVARFWARGRLVSCPGPPFAHQATTVLPLTFRSGATFHLCSCRRGHSKRGSVLRTAGPGNPVDQKSFATVPVREMPLSKAPIQKSDDAAFSAGRPTGRHGELFCPFGLV